MVSRWRTQTAFLMIVSFFTLRVGHQSEVMCLWIFGDVIGRTQVRRGPPDSSPQQTGTSRTVKRYPSSSGPITSNALPSSTVYADAHGNEHRIWYGDRNGHSSAHRPASNSQLHGPFNSALLPGGENKITRNISIAYMTKIIKARSLHFHSC